MDLFLLKPEKLSLNNHPKFVNFDKIDEYRTKIDFFSLRTRINCYLNSEIWSVNF